MSEVRSRAKWKRVRRAEYHGFPLLARVFQWLKNEADYATAQEHPPAQGKRTDLELVTATVISSLPAPRLSELRKVADTGGPVYALAG